MLKVFVCLSLGFWLGYVWGDQACGFRWETLSNPANWPATAPIKKQ